MAGSRIGVLTFHKCVNYGSYWQARCLVEGLQAQGHDAQLIDHHCDGVARAELRGALQPKLPERASRYEMRGYSAKVRNFIRAVCTLPLSRQVSLHRPEGLGKYDVVLIGSDEVWNLSHPWYGGIPLFYGEGLKASRLISYAGSFGSYSCHWGLDEYWAGQLRRFDALSVRDENSYWLVRGVTGRDPAMVLDPCLQFPAAAQAAPVESEQPYVLIYGHGFPDWLIVRLRQWASAAGMRLRSVGYFNGFADGQELSAGPLEFSRLVAGASAVVTNFFHGCIFALLNDKPLTAVTSEYRQNKLRGLTTQLGQEARLLEEDSSSAALEWALTEPPDPAVQSRIGEARERSREYLDAALA